MKNTWKKLAFGLFSLLLVLGIFGAAPAAAESKLFVISDVDYDDPVAPGDVLPVEIELENLGSDDLKDILVKVWIEDDEGERIGNKVKYDINRLGDVETNYNSKEFDINVPIPDNAVEDMYTLHVTAEAEWEATDDKVEDYWISPLEIEQQEHGIYIKNVKLSTDNVIAGEQLDVAVTILNNGQEDQSNIRIKAEISEIGAEKTVAMLNTLGAGYDYTAYLTVDVPSADSGIYTFTVKAYNANAGDTYEQDILMEEVVFVTDDGEAVVDVPVTGAVTQTIEAGQGSIFSIEVKNNANTPKTFDLVVGGAADWATTRIDPTQLTLGPGESEIVYVYVLPTDTGEHAFTLYVKEGGATIAANQVKVNVGGYADTETVTSLKNFFAFLVLVFIVVTAGYLYRKELLGKGKKVYY